MEVILAQKKKYLSPSRGEERKKEKKRRENAE
jgi:hypothetical protein